MCLPLNKGPGLIPAGSGTGVKSPSGLVQVSKKIGSPTGLDYGRVNSPAGLG